MIPTELITMGAGFIGSSVMTLFKQSMDKRHALFQMALTTGKAQAKIYEKARSQDSKSFQMTRRFIALFVICSIVAATLLLPYWIKDIPVHIGLPETTGGFWFFTDPKDTTAWYSFKDGIVLTPVFTHMLSAITGFFFGNQIVK